MFERTEISGNIYEGVVYKYNKKDTREYSICAGFRNKMRVGDSPSMINPGMDYNA